jgi:hypothetical protein
MENIFRRVKKKNLLLIFPGIFPCPFAELWKRIDEFEGVKKSGNVWKNAVSVPGIFSLFNKAQPSSPLTCFSLKREIMFAHSFAL